MIYNFDSTMQGALQMSGTAGALRNILKTYLVDGSGAGPVTSLTVAGGVATATYASGHPFRVGAIAQFSGATPAALNGLKRVLSTAGNSASFAATGVADGAATGSITSKLAPAGWQELFPGTANVLALNPSAVEATGCVLRIDDTGTSTARVVGYETMTDASSGVGAFPIAGQVAGGMHWPKSDAGNATARAWRLFSDGQSFMLHIASHLSYQGHGALFGFGDLLADKSGDAYGCALFGSSNASVSSQGSMIPGCLGFGHAVNAGADVYVPRSYTGIGGSQLAKKVAAHNTAQGYSGTTAYNGNALPYPNSADNSLRITPVEILVGTAGFRGRVAGVYHSPQQLGDAFNTGDLVQGTGVYAGKTLVALRTGPTGAALSGAGTVFVDVTGPWRN